MKFEADDKDVLTKLNLLKQVNIDEVGELIFDTFDDKDFEKFTNPHYFNYIIYFLSFYDYNKSCDSISIATLDNISRMNLRMLQQFDDLSKIAEKSNAFRIISKLPDSMTLKFGNDDYDDLSYLDDDHNLILENAILFIYEGGQLIKLHCEWARFEYSKDSVSHIFDNHFFIKDFNKMECCILSKNTNSNLLARDVRMYFSEGENYILVQIKDLSSLRCDANTLKNLFNSQGYDEDIFLETTVIAAVNDYSDVMYADEVNDEVSKFIELDLSSFDLQLNKNKMLNNINTILFLTII